MLKFEFAKQKIKFVDEQENYVVRIRNSTSMGKEKTLISIENNTTLLNFALKLTQNPIQKISPF